MDVNARYLQVFFFSTVFLFAVGNSETTVKYSQLHRGKIRLIASFILLMNLLPFITPLSQEIRPVNCIQTDSAHHPKSREGIRVNK